MPFGRRPAPNQDVELLRKVHDLELSVAIAFLMIAGLGVLIIWKEV